MKNAMTVNEVESEMPMIPVGSMMPAKHLRSGNWRLYASATPPLTKAR